MKVVGRFLELFHEQVVAVCSGFIWKHEFIWYGKFVSKF
jgi:hypothetical protein